LIGWLILATTELRQNCERVTNLQNQLPKFGYNVFTTISRHRNDLRQIRRRSYKDFRIVLRCFV